MKKLSISQQNKISQIDSDINVLLNDNETLEGQIVDSAKISTLINDLPETFVGKTDVLPGLYVEGKTFTDFYKDALIDVKTINYTIGHITNKISKLKEDIEVKRGHLKAGIGKVNSTLDTLALYNSAVSNNIRSSQETFSSDEDVDLSGSFSASPLFVNLTEGIVTLPHKELIPISLRGSTFVIDPSSNGSFTSGYKFENTLDNIENTYCEYTGNSTLENLVLQVTIKLSGPQIINNIIVVPNNYGTNNFVDVEDISMSLAGAEYTTVFTAYDKISVMENNDRKSFNSLSYTFLPQQASYIKLRFIQRSLNAENVFKIGIKSINFNTIKYEDSGDLLIKKTVNEEEVASVSVHEVSRVIDNDNLKTNYSFSLDSQIWNNVQAVTSDETIPEILYYNQPWMKDSISIDSAITDKLYLRIFMNKVKDKLVIGPSTAVGKTEFFSFVNKPPYKYTLSETILPDTLKVVALPYAAFGIPDKNVIDLGKTSANNYYYTFELPFDPNYLEEVYIGTTKIDRYENPRILYDLYVIGYIIDTETNRLHISLEPAPEKKDKDLYYWDKWIKAPDPAPANTTEAEAQSYLLNELLANQPIKMFLKPEYIVPDSSGILHLSASSDGIANNFDIRRTILDQNGDTLIESISDLIPARQTIIKLSSYPLLEEDIDIEGGYRVEFSNGGAEFVNADAYAYSIDINNRLLYLRDAYDVDVSIRYKHKIEYSLSVNDFEIMPDLSQVLIYPWALDISATYRVAYNMSVELPSEYFTYNAKLRALTVAPETVTNILYGADKFSDKTLMITYKYLASNQLSNDQYLQHSSPILNNVSIIYSINNA